ncbi:BatD family protein [Legionella yabuuchiae]|uniref:BatD family protein n=1 Tax=Legionella yabuuchiae TaxID=376727 RepID=UPI0010553DE7|nr:BatD family protein [Legionella yabuuchiae]
MKAYLSELKSKVHFNQCFLLIFLSVWVSVAVAEITAQIKPDKIQYGDTFHLIITSDDQQPALPNLTPLQKDFRIVGTERAMSYTVINGQPKSISQFIVLLMPKTTGTLTIPSLKIGNQQTRAFTVEVRDQPAIPPSQDGQPADGQDEVLIKTEVSKKRPFISEQVVFSVKLFNSGRLLDAQYQPPKVENALLIPLGDADRYQTIEKGRNYVVEEQRYAIFPQKSGVLTITGPAFHALAYEAIPRQINIPPATTQLQVRPIPKDFKDKFWLPAKQVSLSETYDNPQHTAEVGETLTRFITIEAVALPAQLLPSLEFEDKPDYNVYPEKPNLRNTIRDHELVGTAEIKVTYLLNKPGQIILPEMSLSWLNTTTGNTEIAKLPPRTITVTGVEKAKETLSDSDPTETAIDQTPQQLEPSPESKEAVIAEASTPLAWFLAIIFAVGWILTLMIWWFKPKIAAGSKRRLAIKRLHEACINNNPTKARDALLNWASLHWPDKEFMDLNEIAKQVPDPRFKRQMKLLSQAIYSPGNQIKWQGSELWVTVANYRKRKRKKNNRDTLPPINP